jgi:NAD(P)H-hydrate repair Nnr-like enzyme with NAD(P)H-hydrate epimerase domain
MAIKTLGAKAAAALDQELMSTGAFSLDQLMELAGLAVSQAGKLLNSLDTSYRSLYSFCIVLCCIIWPKSVFYDVQPANITSVPPPTP